MVVAYVPDVDEQSEMKTYTYLWVWCGHLYGSGRRLGGHRGLELVEGDDSVAVSVHCRDDLCTPLGRHLLQRAAQLLRILGGGSAQHVRLVAVLEQRSELLEADEPVLEQQRAGDAIGERPPRRRKFFSKGNFFRFFFDKAYASFID